MQVQHTELKHRLQRPLVQPKFPVPHFSVISAGGALAYQFQSLVVLMSDAGVEELCSLELVLWHFLRYRKGSEREKGASKKHGDRIWAEAERVPCEDSKWNCIHLYTSHGVNGGAEHDIAQETLPMANSAGSKCTCPFLTSTSIFAPLPQ